jgi:hypothetical protein
MGRIFTGDYSTGDLSQWIEMQNITAGGGTVGAMFWDDYRDLLGTYPVTMVREDTDCGYAARFEIQTGDSGAVDNERSEVRAPSSAINVTRWEAFSIKFDETYPINSSDYTNGWAVTNQYPDAFGLGWTFGPNQLDGATPSGMWTLNYFGGVDSNIRLLDVPMNRGNWIDVKMHIGWYDSASGFVRVWINGVRQTLRYGSWAAPRLVAPSLSPSDTFTGQTVWNNTSGTFYYKEGLYRNRAAVYPTGIVYHANYRTSTDEAGL